MVFDFRPEEGERPIAAELADDRQEGGPAWLPALGYPALRRAQVRSGDPGRLLGGVRAITPAQCLADPLAQHFPGIYNLDLRHCLPP